MRNPSLIIFDFDGVVADSETLAASGEAEFLTSIGHPTSPEQAMQMFLGKNHADTVAAMEQYIGRRLPEHYEATHRQRVRGKMRAEVTEIAGVARFLDAHMHIPRCIASSSSRAWLDHCVDKFGFRHAFGDDLYSATLVQNGKPAPDIFLYAADRMGVAPGATVVLEDSPAGVKGAVAAGMHVIGFLGGSHIRAGHGEKLLATGAHALAHDYAAVARLIAGEQY